MIRGIFNAITDPRVRREWRFLALVRLGQWLQPGYRFQWPQMLWWHDPEFNAYLEKFDLQHGHEGDRRWMLHQLTKLAQALPGATAECGVWIGSSSYLICRSLRRRHFAFDSFQGMSKPEAADGDYFSQGGLTCELETARRNLAEFPDVTFHQGWIPERFAEANDHRFCFVHIDVQLYQPTLDSLAFFYPRMHAGGVMVCDDYGFTTCPGARRAVDEFLADKPEKMMEMPCGSAFLIRQRSTISGDPAIG